MCLKKKNIQMYADDLVIFTKNIQETTLILTSAMTHVQYWLTKSGLL